MCAAVCLRCAVVLMRTMVDLDDDALSAAARELGTTTKKDTVNAALRAVAERRERLAALLEDAGALGVGSDIDDPDVMAGARR